MKETKEKPKHPGGRPSKFYTINIEQLKKLAELGLTDKQMAYAIGISEDTFYEYKKKPEFSEPLKKGKAISDEKVERSLFERATGYSHPEDKMFCYEGQVIVEPTIKHYPPDTTAAIFWLKNRKPNEWRDKQEVNHSGSIEQKVISVDAGSNPYPKTE